MDGCWLMLQRIGNPFCANLVGVIGFVVMLIASSSVILSSLMYDALALILINKDYFC